MLALPVAVGAVELELYSVAHMSVDTDDDGQNRSESIASNSSRLGLRGRQQIGPGLEVVFQYEQGIDLTGEGENDGNGPGSSSSLFTASRDSYLGLSGRLGTIRGGKLGGLNQWVYDYNLFADQVGDLGNLWGGTGLPGRVSSMGQYVSPDLAGFGFSLSYAPEEGIDDADIVLLGAHYEWRGLKLGAGYIDLGGGTSRLVDRRDRQAWALTGSYDFGPLSIGGGWQRDLGIDAAPGNDRNSFSVGSAWTAGTKWTLKSQFTWSDSSLPDADASQWAIGLDYAWMPELTVYLAYSSVRNDENAAFSANNYGKGDARFPLPGDNPDALSAGIVYRFSASFSR